MAGSTAQQYNWQHIMLINFLFEHRHILGSLNQKSNRKKAQAGKKPNNQMLFLTPVHGDFSRCWVC